MVRSFIPVIRWLCCTACSAMADTFISPLVRVVPWSFTHRFRVLPVCPTYVIPHAPHRIWYTTLFLWSGGTRFFGWTRIWDKVCSSLKYVWIFAEASTFRRASEVSRMYVWQHHYGLWGGLSQSSSWGHSCVQAGIVGLVESHSASGLSSHAASPCIGHPLRNAVSLP